MANVTLNSESTLSERALRLSIPRVVLGSMKLSLLQKNDMTTLPQIPRNEVAILWCDDFYDGPLAGMAEVRGSRCLFEIIDRDVLGTEEETRAFWLVSLTPHQFQEEERWHELFCRNVGTHFDFTGRLPLPPENVCMDSFYEPYRKRVEPDYRSNDVIGWFQL